MVALFLHQLFRNQSWSIMNPSRLFLIAAAALVTTTCTSQKKNSAAPPKSQTTDLPEPYATPDVTKNSRVIGWPADSKPVAPEGFVVTKFAGGLNSPRWFYVTPNGDLLVSESQTN